MQNRPYISFFENSWGVRACWNFHTFSHFLKRQYPKCKNRILKIKYRKYKSTIIWNRPKPVVSARKQGSVSTGAIVKYGEKLGKTRRELPAIGLCSKILLSAPRFWTLFRWKQFLHIFGYLPKIYGNFTNIYEFITVLQTQAPPLYQEQTPAPLCIQRRSKPPLYPSRCSVTFAPAGI